MANRPQEVWLMCFPGYWDRLGWTDSAVPLVVRSCPTKVGLKEFSMIKSHLRQKHELAKLYIIRNYHYNTNSH